MEGKVSMFSKVKLSIRRLSRWLHQNQSGQSLIIIALAFVGLVAIVGLAIDLGIMYIEKTRLSQAVDAAALAGAHELPNEIAAWDRAEEFLRLNGYNPNDPDVTFTHDFPDEPHLGLYHYQLLVTGTKSVPLTFLKVLGFTTIDVTANAVGENVNRLDVMLVVDRTGSMDDDTCDITRTDPQYACNPWYINIATEFFDDFGSGLVNWSTQGNVTMETGQAKLGGGSSPGLIERQFVTTPYDVVKVTFKAKTSGLDSGWWQNERLCLFYRIGAAGDIEEIWCGRPTSWVAYQKALPTGAAGIDNLYVGFRLYANQSNEYALLDDVALVGANDGLGPCDGTGCSAKHGRRCTGGGGQDCGGSADPFLQYFHEQPIYDTLAAADYFLTFLDPDLDQVGLASYSTSGRIDEELQFDFSLVTETLYDPEVMDPDGCTNLGDGILAGISGLSTGPGHNGRSNAVHILIILSDGKANQPGGGSWCSENETAREHAREAARQARDDSIVIFTITQGEDVNRALMQEIAEIGLGREFWAPTTDELDEVFEDIARYIFLRLVR